MTDFELIMRAVQARKQAYAPYSGFAVGAALLTAGGGIFCGCNVESAAYGACTCAERGAISAAVLAGETQFLAIAVVGGEGDYCAPCGICRQILCEFSPKCRVLCAKEDGSFEEHLAGELLPFGFTL